MKREALDRTIFRYRGIHFGHPVETHRAAKGLNIRRYFQQESLRMV